MLNDSNIIAVTFKRLSVLVLAAAALILSSCAKYDVNTNIYPSLAEISAAGGEITTTFVSNAAWTVSCEEDGLSFNPSSGIAGTWTVVITVPPSTRDVEKTWKVKLQAKYDSDVSTRYFTITQHPAR
ncbi:MAG: BACON domain-containing protein [Bacteroidales bacterium]|nr:BACON domain-containing protein [Bacteroidales bacterium]